MALVEVARFLDLTEAQTAASALRSSGMPVFVQNENWGQTEAYMQMAMGGFRLWTPEEEAADAKAFITESSKRSHPETQAAEESPVVTIGAVLLASVFGVFGWMLAPLLISRRDLPDDELPQDERIP